jgi:uncharacterized membrane protein YhaH (DUF805 family)
MNYFLDVIRNKYAQFNGRARRAEYWQFLLFNIIISVIINVLVRATGSTIIAGIGGMVSLALLIPGIAVAIRRMHDVDKSGWFILIPIYNLILACTEGTKGDNEYGPDPKGNANAFPISTPPASF